MTKHHDESMALAALFDCWTPQWRKVDGPHGFHADISDALHAFGFVSSRLSPFRLVRMGIGPLPVERAQETAILLTGQQLRSPEFIHAFRRRGPRVVILAAKSSLWWAVWGHAVESTVFRISTAEYVPSKNRA